MYDVTLNELDKMILRQNNIFFLNPKMMSSCVLSVNPDYVTYTDFLICIGLKIYLLTLPTLLLRSKSHQARKVLVWMAK